MRELRENHKKKKEIFSFHGQRKQEGKGLIELKVLIIKIQFKQNVLTLNSLNAAAWSVVIKAANYNTLVTPLMSVCYF